MALDIKKFIGRFVDEAQDHLGQLNSGLSALEHGAASAEQVHSLFRSAHTLKGSSRMLKLEPITQLAHSLEDLLSALREQQVQVNHTVMDALYQGVDALSDQVEQLHKNGQLAELTAVQNQLCQQLSALAQNQTVDSDNTKNSNAQAPVTPTVTEPPRETPSDVARRPS